MKTQDLSAVLEWINKTDLVSVRFKEGAEGFTFALPGQNPEVPCYFPGPKLIPVTSQWIGVFQWNQPGKPRKLHEGDAAAAGELLGVVDTGLKKTAGVTAPCAGRLARVLVDAGDSVQFGQPLFFIEPKA